MHAEERQLLPCCGWHQDGDIIHPQHLLDAQQKRLHQVVQPRVFERHVADCLQGLQLPRLNLSLLARCALSLIELGMLDTKHDAAGDHLQQLTVLVGEVTGTSAVDVENADHTGA